MGNGFVHLRAVAVKKAATGARSSGGKNHGARSCVWRRNAHLAVVSFASWHVLPFDAATHLSSPLLPQRRLLLCYECRADHCTVIPTIAPERSVRQALSFSICTSRVLLTYSTTFSFAHVQHEQVGKRESCVVGALEDAGYETRQAGQINARITCNVYNPLLVTYNCRVLVRKL